MSRASTQRIVIDNLKLELQAIITEDAVPPFRFVVRYRDTKADELIASRSYRTLGAAKQAVNRFINRGTLKGQP